VLLLQSLQILIFLDLYYFMYEIMLFSQSIEVTPQFKTELDGLEYGARDKGCNQCGQYITRAIVLANAPGDLQDFIYVLMR